MKHTDMENVGVSADELGKRIKWIIGLRWIAVIGVFGAISTSKYILGIELPVLELYICNIVLLIYNAVFFYYEKISIREKSGIRWITKANHFANTQISLDLIMLILMIHYSGGVENPFIFYFIFHMVNASILLSNKAAYLQATLAVVLLGLIMYGEATNTIPHYVLDGLLFGELYRNPKYLFSMFFVFTSTVYITVYMATSIVNKLRLKEEKLTIANVKLEEQDRLKSQYVQTVSHDLKASLATIQSCLKVVLVNLTDPISEKSREMIARAEQRTMSVLHFVRNLLDLSRIRMAKEIKKEELSLATALNKVIEQLKPKAEEKGLSLSQEFSEGEYMINANPVAIDQLLVNLVMNAIKYTPWNGSVGVQLEEQEENIKLTAWDTGIGISQEDIKSLFDDFFRAKNAEDLVKDGTGLGLSIVKQIVDVHHGDIWVESQLGKGSKFFITLPKKWRQND